MGTSHDITFNNYTHSLSGYFKILITKFDKKFCSRPGNIDEQIKIISVNKILRYEGK